MLVAAGAGFALLLGDALLAFGVIAVAAVSSPTGLLGLLLLSADPPNVKELNPGERALLILISVCSVPAVVVCLVAASQHAAGLVLCVSGLATVGWIAATRVLWRLTADPADSR